MAKKIKILFAIGNLNIGGAEKLVINQLKNIDKAKFEPHLGTLFSSGPHNYDAWLAGLPDVPRHQFHFKGPYDIFSWLKVFLFLRREKFDILCTHLFEANFIIRTLNYFSGVKTVFIFEHNIYWQKEWWKILADRALAKKTAKIFVDSQAILDFTSKQEKINPNKFAILPYPIELTEPKIPDKEKIKSSLGLPAESFVVGSVARFVKQKGQVYLIKAAAEILKKIDRPDIHFLLVGYGPMEAELKQLVADLNIGDRVFISPSRDIKTVLLILDLFVISSLWEGQPIAMLEAMAAGCPVVATKVGGVPEAVVDGKNGLLAEPEDANSLAEKIIKLAEDGELRAGLAEAAKATAEGYGLPRYIKKLEEYLIQEYVSNNKH